MKLVQWLFGAALFTASFDLILIVNVGGSFRFAQLLLIPIVLLALVHIMKDGRILWARGSTALLLWVLGQFLFLANSGNLAIGIEFFVLLIFTVCGYFAVIQLYAASDYIERLMRIYLLSYVFVACCGLLQFFLVLTHVAAPLVTQWIVHGKVARISAFSYEPSFFATYVMMGWIMLVELRLSKSPIVAGTFWGASTTLVTAALILSTSKTAWIFMVVELVARVLPDIWRSLLHSLRQLQVGRVLIPIPRARYVALAALGPILLAVVVLFVSRFTSPTIFLAGTGLANTPAHSVVQRSDEAKMTYAAFKEHPWIGRSLGGVPVYLAAKKGILVTNRDQVRKFWGFPVPLDVLVASGIIGVIPFLVFAYALTIGALRLARRRWPDQRALWLRALARAMIFEWMLLMADQNLLRVYLWFHFSMVAVVAYNLEFCPLSAPSAPIASADPPMLPAAG